METRYQVFASSTYEDLQEERREVMQTLLTLDCIPTGMELFPAADDDSWTHIKRFIAECDYYIVIVGGRYGSRASTGRSYTEMEYDYAIEAGLPVLAFLHKDPGAIPANKTEGTDEGKTALTALRTKIEAARHAKYWSSPKELRGLAAVGMASLMKIKPRVGWVRADRIPNESATQEIRSEAQKSTNSNGRSPRMNSQHPREARHWLKVTRRFPFILDTRLSGDFLRTKTSSAGTIFFRSSDPSSLFTHRSKNSRISSPKRLRIDTGLAWSQDL
jgi:hypothetical protein